ncbi:MAG: GDP-mannose 4,6-dehydratase [Simkaniaceae bacterium]|nr:GDP-mannose 4,6-dehydratase [Simkaniaceae bacterium]
MEKMKIFITGISGFIGFHTAIAMSKLGIEVHGCDNFNAYYDPALKRARQAILRDQGVDVIECDIQDVHTLGPLFDRIRFTHFFHLAAQAGVRESMRNPQLYVDSNLNGFIRVLELIAGLRQDIRFVFASSSSVYGVNQTIPFKESDVTDQPASLYAATKKANELIAHSYHHIYKIPMTGLRFFTVYGPWGRPDMAYYKFTQSIDQGKPIPVYGDGTFTRDFTYIDDIVSGILATLKLTSSYDVFNLGNNKPQSVNQLVSLIEERLGKKAEIIYEPQPPGDVITTFADTQKSEQTLHYYPKVSFEKGLDLFIDWYLSYHHKSEPADLLTLYNSCSSI